MTRRLLFLLIALLAVPVSGQTPQADWQTLTTPHFRLHFPAPFEAFAERAAARLESARTVVNEEIGYAPPQVVDVIIHDPVAMANGAAWPFLDTPRMILWTTPPPPQSQIGSFTDWLDLLTIHEQAHLAHLLRPSRNPYRRLLARVLPVGPIGLAAPRWVSEGYATLLEGRLTGAGRPHSAMRAAILREWARSGRMPSYRQLASDSRSWLGMSMAYLVGSAFLDWLEAREGEESLQHLWARMTARQTRSFAEAFEGVFGERPERLYARFTAELTAEAIAEERNREGNLRRGELWQDLAWTTGEPDVSHRGDRLSLVVRGRNRPSRLIVWSTAPEEEAERKWRERIERMIERDPEDVAPVRTRPLPREPLQTLQFPKGIDAFTPRWLPGDEAILFVRFEPDAKEVLHPDLFIWHPDDGQVRRVTREADVREADPYPDGARAVAVRSRHGFSQLVRVDLDDGSVVDLTPPSLDVIYSHPVVDPSGDRVAFVRHSEGAWRLTLLEQGAMRDLAVRHGSVIAQPAWSRDGRVVFASTAIDGDSVDIVAYPVAAENPYRVTRMMGAALAPAAAPDALFFLALEVDGFDLHRIGLPVDDVDAVPAVQPSPRPLRQLELPAIEMQAEAYGIGRQEPMYLIGGGAGAGGGLLEGGLRLGDVVGRLDTIAVAAEGGGDAPRGAAIATAWRGWPVAVSLRIFRWEEALRAEGEQPDRRTATGGELIVSWDRVARWRRAEISAGHAVASLGTEAADDESERVTFAHAGTEWTPVFGSLELDFELSARVDRSSRADATWWRGGAALSAGAAIGDYAVALAIDRRSSDEVPEPFDAFVVGGLDSSIVPSSARLRRVFEPGVPFAAVGGDDYRKESVSARVPWLPLALFYARHSAWSEGGDLQRLAQAGVRWEGELPPFPLVKLPALRMTAGAARLLDAPFDGDIEWWLSIVWKP